MTPFSKATTTFNPISIGCTPNLANIPAALVDIGSPALAKTLLLLITTLPASTAAIIPACPNSPIIGPGGKLVGPGSTANSLGAICPGLAATKDFDFLIVV